MSNNIYPDLRVLYQEAGLPFPEAHDENYVSPIATETPTFQNRKVDVANNNSKQTNQSSDNSLNSTCKPLEDRKIQNIIQQKNNLRVLKIMYYTFLTLILSILVNVSLAAYFPLFTIGIVVSILLIIPLVYKYTQFCCTTNLIGLQNMTINVLLDVLKDNPLANDISPDNNTDLSSLLNNAINSLPVHHLKYMIGLMLDYIIFKDSEVMAHRISERSVRLELEDFIEDIFNNAELTDHLRKLNLDVEALQQSAQNYIHYKPISELCATIRLNT